MDIKPELVKQLREMTGAGMMDCKRALQEAEGDIERAVELLRAKGLSAAAKRAGRTANEGVVESYIHLQGKLGVLVEVNSETDFVANTDEFRTLGREIAMQIAATDPSWVARDEVPGEELDRERKVYEEQAREQGKPDNIVPKIVEGKLEAYYKERVLLEQPWIKDDSKTIGDMVTEASSKVGEKIHVRRFARFRVGEE